MSVYCGLVLLSCVCGCLIVCGCLLDWLVGGMVVCDVFGVCVGCGGACVCGPGWVWLGMAWLWCVLLVVALA